jgi:Eco57I restriction-modification methylase/TaqI-like C-terminal specificity domain
MKEKILKDSLQQAFDFAIWQKILPLFFKKINYFSRPENLFTENDKVIDGKQIGIVKLDDGKQLAIFIVEVADTISIVRNRQGLRDIAAKHIDQNIIHGALAFFYNKNQGDYRFSFIAKEASINLETGELIKGETKPKRYTYLLGANEACTTPAKRMLVLADKKEKGEVNINQLKDVFSVEALNKDFFKTYKAHYEKFWKYLADKENPYRITLIDTTKDDTVKQEKPIRDFTKKLLGRIVFLHFLQKKGWMGCSPETKDWIDGEPRFMQQLFEDFTKPENFQSQCLTHLFFEALNTKRPNDIFEVKGLKGKLNGSRVPYLNGGLFEPEKNKATLKIDFPVDYFKELLDFFEQYNFTIDENSPDDHEVGIDPEMLGHIFENLLEDNRDKGAFYTPKEIVQYMCKESLIQYLKNSPPLKSPLINSPPLEGCPKDGVVNWDTAIEAFIRFHSISPILTEKDNAVLLNQKLDDIKVCDPAIGSGAFPIGMLQEIFEAKRFIYPYLKTNQDFKPAQVKKNIIQHSIYGVDLEKGAVDIAQLRFWLSLVVDELNPHPLPNLDYKIMQGNSLLETFQKIDLSQIGKSTDNVLMTEPERDLFGNLTDEQMKITFSQSDTSQKIQDLIKIFFTIEVSKQKNEIRAEINQLVLQHIEYNLKVREDQLHCWISEAGNIENLKTAAKKKYDGYVNDLNTLQHTKAQLLDIQETDERPYFLWHLYFMDVFDKGGFDVMIGNPPYISAPNMVKNNPDGRQAIIDSNKFESLYQKWDIYVPFMEFGLKHLSDIGVFTMIVPYPLTNQNYAQKLRELILKKYTLTEIVDLNGKKIFNNATVSNCIPFIVKLGVKKKSCVISKLNEINKIQKTFEQNYSDLVQDKNTLVWNLTSEKRDSIGHSNLNILGDFCYLSVGMVLNADEKSAKGEFSKDDLLSDTYNEKNCRKYLDAKDIERYNVKKIHYLEYNTERVPDKLRRPTFRELYEQPKLMFNRLGNLQVYFDENTKYLHSDSMFSAVLWQDLNGVNNKSISASVKRYSRFGKNEMEKLSEEVDLKYLLGILNSKYASVLLSNLRGGDYHIYPEHLRNMPIPKAAKLIQDKIIQLTNYLIYLNDPKQAPALEKASNESVSQVFEDLVNMMVYELYFTEEMKAKEIDVLQFITEKAFPDITQAKDKKAIIQKVYYELQQKDNAIRNRIDIASSRSETIARIEAATS